MGKVPGTIAFIFLIIVATLGLGAYIMQNAFDDPTMTFKDLFEILMNR